MKPTLAALALFAAACGSSSTTTPAIDARPSIDASTGGQPDSPLVLPDAPAGTPDSPAAKPDAATPKPDAAPTAVDAPATPDGPSGSTCLPQCYVDGLSGLVSACLPSGGCTSNFIVASLTQVTCWGNDVKFVTMIGLQGSTTTTVKKANGDTCYTLTTTATSATSATLVWKNAAGTAIVEIDIPDTNTPNLQNYICGNSAPVSVDLNSAACQSVRPDAGPGGDAGSSCPMNASCQP